MQNQTATVYHSIESVLCGCKTWTMVKNHNKQLDGCYTRMFRVVFNVHWQQHLTNRDLHESSPKQLERGNW